nr:hypothetical protein [Candidatus Saccharibacteria bacterium]
MARSAAEAGIQYAKACMDLHGVPQWSDAMPLRQDTDCTGMSLNTTTTASILVVAGGGGGGANMGG